MAKYSFNVYLENEGSKRMVPSTMTNTDLYDMDKFVEEQDGYFNFRTTIARELGVNSSLIQKITIVSNKSEMEFSLVNNNQYLKPVLNDLHLKKIQGERKYQLETMVVSSDNHSYIEMKKYLFSNMQADYEFFLREVYPYNNEFSKLLYKYGIIYSQSNNREENEKELRRLENIISLELSIYKNYRGLCRSRKKYEEGTYNRTRNRQNQNNLQVASTIYSNPNYNVTKEFPSIKEIVADYNQECEEFLDEDEYLSMADGEEVFKGYK